MMLLTQQELVADRNTQFSIYKLSFAIDYTLPAPDLASGDHFGGRIRRIAVTGAGTDEVEGEIILLDFYITYDVNKVYKQT